MSAAGGEGGLFADFFDKLRNDRTMSLLDRVEELRKRVFRIVCVATVLFGLAMWFDQEIFAWLKAPLAFALPQGASLLHFTGPLDVFMAYIRVAFMGSALLTSPWALWEMWSFLKPAVPEWQGGGIGRMFVASVLLLYGGVALCYYAILPTTMDVLLGMGEGVAKPMITVGDYVSLVTLMMLGFGVVFQLPIAVLVAERFGIVQLRDLTRFRGAVLVVILVIAAIATPTPDPFSQLAMATPMYLMYEIAVLIIWLRRRKEAQPSKPR